MAMHRLSNQKACFLSNSTENLPKPADLKKLLDMVSKFSSCCSITAPQTDRDSLLLFVVCDISIRLARIVQNLFHVVYFTVAII